MIVLLAILSRARQLSALASRYQAHALRAADRPLDGGPSLSSGLERIRRRDADQIGFSCAAPMVESDQIPVQLAREPHAEREL